MAQKSIFQATWEERNVGAFLFPMTTWGMSPTSPPSKSKVPQRLNEATMGPGMVPHGLVWVLEANTEDFCVVWRCPSCCHLCSVTCSYCITDMTSILLMLFKLSRYYITRDEDNSKTWQDKWVWEGERGSDPPILYIYHTGSREKTGLGKWPTLWHSQGLHSVASID